MFKIAKYRRDLFPKLRHMLFGCNVHLINNNVRIIMNQNVSQPRSLFPGNIGIACTHALRDALGRLSDNLKTANNRILQVYVASKLLNRDVPHIHEYTIA